MGDRYPEPIKPHGAQLEWDVAEAAPVLLERLRADAPWIAEELGGLRAAVPTAATCEPFTAGDYFRPHLHMRCFYRKGPGAGVLAIKGTEVMAEDVVQLMEGLRTIRHKATVLSALEHFAVREHKVGFALLRREALSEARAAAQFQGAYLGRYGCLARAPVPLFVFAWPSSIAEQHCARICELVSETSAQSIRRLVADGGLGVYVYYYPGMPLRWRDREPLLAGARSTGGYEKRWTELCKHLNPEQAITGWTRMLVRILALGYFPCILSQLSMGNCLQPQNVALDGGIFDLDSLQPFHKVLDEREFHESFFTSLIFFTQTLQRVMQAGYFDPSDLGIGVNFMITFARLWEELKRLVDEERRAGSVFDARLEKIWSGTGSFTEDLRATFTALYPPSYSQHVGNPQPPPRPSKT